MKSKASTSGVLRRNGRLPPSLLRCYPYDSGRSGGSGKKEMKEEVVGLGVELSLYVAQSLLLLSDDMRTMLWFCATLWRCVTAYQDCVLQRLLLVIHYVYSKEIKPKKNAFVDGGNSVHWELIGSAWEDFADGIIVLGRLILVVGRKDYSFDDRLLSSAFLKYKQVLKKLDDKLTCVSEANGFARETFEPHIFNLWKSLFDDEAGEAAPKVIRTSILTDMFTPLLHKPIHSGMLALPPHSPYILGMDFAKQELKEEVARLGVELSLYVAQSMFLLCDDIRSMLRFCLKLWRDAKGDDDVVMMIPDSPVVERLLGAIHYAYSKYIKPKHGVYQQSDGQSVQWELIRTTWENFDSGIRDLDRLVLNLRGKGSCCFDGREFTSRIEGALRKVDEKLSCAKEANGFAREAMEPDIWGLWKSLFDKEAKPVINHGILADLFLPLCIEAAPR